MGYFVSTSGLAKATGARIDLYVAPAVGDDSGPGTAAQPLATLDEAIRRLNYYAEISADPLGSGLGFVIHLASSNAYSWGVTVGPHLLNESVVVICDGAGQPGDDGFVELLASTAAVAGSSIVQVVTGGGLGTNTYRDKTIEILTGAAAGDRRTIRDHTDTTIIPYYAFSAAIAAGDTFRIVESGATIDLFAAFNQLVDSCGASGGWDQLLGIPGLLPRFALVNAKVTGSLVKCIARSTVSFYGVEKSNAGNFTFSVVRSGFFAGCDSRGPRAPLGLRLGAPSDTSWLGWGVVNSVTGLQFFRADEVAGFFGSAAHLFVEGGRFDLIGGSVRGSTANPALVTQRDPTELLVGPSTTTNAIPPAIAHSGSQPAIGLGVGSVSGGVQTAADIRNATLTSASGPALRCRGSVRCNVGVGVTGGGTFGIDSSYGAHVTTAGQPALTGSTGDLTVDAGATSVANTTLGAAGDAVFNTANGSVIVRQS